MVTEDNVKIVLPPCLYLILRFTHMLKKLNEFFKYSVRIQLFMSLSYFKIH